MHVYNRCTLHGIADFGIHKAVLYDGDGFHLSTEEWTVTHLPTGRFVAHGSSRTDAVEKAGRQILIEAARKGITVAEVMESWARFERIPA